MGYSGAGSVSRMRDAVSSASKADAESMSNLAYVVNSANDNIAALQRTLKLQEKELADKSEHSAALQLRRDPAGCAQRAIETSPRGSRSERASR